MKFGYARVSTKDQNLDMQIDALKKAGCEKIFMEKESGKKNDRPERERLLEQLREGDTVVVYHIFRFGRSLVDLVTKVNDLRMMGVNFISLTNHIDTSNSNGRFQMNVFASLAEYQRENIVENTKAGLLAARSRGRIGGRKEKLTEKQKKEVVEAFAKGGINVTQIAKTYGVTRSTVYNIVNQSRQ